MAYVNDDEREQQPTSHWLSRLFSCQYVGGPYYMCINHYRPKGLKALFEITGLLRKSRGYRTVSGNYCCVCQREVHHNIELISSGENRVFHPRNEHQTADNCVYCHCDRWLDWDFNGYLTFDNWLSLLCEHGDGQKSETALLWASVVLTTVTVARSNYKYN
jgi:hypothetical protein